MTPRPPPLVPRRLRRIVVSCALGVVTLSCLGVLAALALARSTPSWWGRVARDDPATITLAEQVENGLVNHAYRRRDEPWTIEITAEQANAWLNVRLPKWSANQGHAWPGEIGEMQVAFTPGRIMLGARVLAGGRWHVISTDVTPRLEHGGLYLDARRVGVGRLGAPPAVALRVAAPLLPTPDLRDRLRRTAEGDVPLARPAVVSLEDGRRVRVVAIEPGEGWLHVTLQTEPLPTGP